MGVEDIFAARLEEARGENMIPALQSFWKEELEQAERMHRSGTGGMGVARAIADRVDAVVLTAYRNTLDKAPGRHALVAIGGCGRREVGPHSDIDMLFLFARDRDKSPEFISGVLNPLWDLRFDVGHSSRTVAETIRFAREDVESCTAMMDARFLAGDGDLFTEFLQRFFKRLPRSAIGKLQNWRQLRLESRDSVQLLEPNIKESPGGLRDIQTLEWALKIRAESPDTDSLWHRYLDDRDIETLEEGRDFLWKVRHELHFSVGRKRDVLEHDLKRTIAGGLGYEDSGQELGVERFMHQYYMHARRTYHLVELAFERLTRKTRNAHRSMMLERGVTAIDGEIILDRGEQYFAEEPLRLLRIFHIAQAKNVRLSEEGQRTIGACLHLIDDELCASSEARGIFLRILRRKHRVARTLRLMHDLGVLGAYLPEWGDLTCLVQYDIYHIYTVDEHTLVAIDNLERLGTADTQSPLKPFFQQYERRDLLYLAVMLHDVGKSKRQDHIVCGVEMTRELGRRLRLAEEDLDFLLFQVEHHQEMVILSQRRDLDDYKMIAEFASLFPSMEWLQGLYLLSYADLSAVSADAWTDWQGALLWELYHKTGEQLESGMKTLEQMQQGRHLLDEHLKAVSGKWPAPRVMAFQEHAEKLPPRYLAAYSREQIENHLQLVDRSTDDSLFEVEFVERPTFTEMLICTPDQRQLLAKICGALAVNDVNILRAEINTRADDVVLDIFQVTDVDGSPILPDWKKERICERLEEVIALRQKARELLERYSAHWERRKQQKRAYVLPPVLQIENQISDRYTVIDLDVQDDVGLLYEITHCLSELGLDIHMAIVNTIANRARDGFYVVDGQGEKIVNYQVLEEIRQDLLEKLAD